MQGDKLVSVELIKIEVTAEQAGFIRFCSDNCERIKFFQRKHLFDYSNGSITINYKPSNEIQSVHFHMVDNECE